MLRLLLTIGLLVSTNACGQGLSAIDVQTYGAVGDCITDDASAINSAILGASGSARVYFPSPPGGCYLIKSSINIPAPSPANHYLSQLMLEGDGPNISVIRAAAAMVAVIEGSSTYSNGITIKNLWIDAAGKASYGIDVRNGSYVIADSWSTNGLIADVNLAYSSILRDCYLWNQDTIFTSAGVMPPYNLKVTGADSQIRGGYFINASIANIYDTNGQDNEYIGTHAYNYSNTIPPNTFGTYNYYLSGGRVIGNEGDNATQATFYLTGFAPTLIGNNMAWDPTWGTGATPNNGIEIASGIQNVYVVGNSPITPLAAAKIVVQDGSTGINQIVANNGVSLYGNQGPILSGQGQNVSGGIAGYPLGYLGNFGRMNGVKTFGLGDNVDDFFRYNGELMASSSQSNFSGDAQTWRVVMHGSATSGTVDLLSSNTNIGRFPGNTILLSTFAIPSAVSVNADVTATCSTGDVARWQASFTIHQPSNAGTVTFVSPSGANVAPTWTLLSQTSGAASAGWVPQVVLDQTNHSAVIQGTNSACPGGKTVYWVARVETVETADGTN